MPKIKGDEIMPGRDGTGPNGTGSMTGHRFGRKNKAPGFHRFGCHIDTYNEVNDRAVDEKTALKANAAYLEMKLKEINKRIETLK
jgi:hypothetical protein